MKNSDDKPKPITDIEEELDFIDRDIKRLHKIVENPKDLLKELDILARIRMKLKQELESNTLELCICL